MIKLILVFVAAMIAGVAAYFLAKQLKFQYDCLDDDQKVRVLSYMVILPCFMLAGLFGLFIVVQLF